MGRFSKNVLIAITKAKQTKFCCHSAYARPTAGLRNSKIWFVLLSLSLWKHFLKARPPRSVTEAQCLTAHMLLAFYDGFLNSRNATLYFRVGRPSAGRRPWKWILATQILMRAQCAPSDPRMFWCILLTKLDPYTSIMMHIIAGLMIFSLLAHLFYFRLFKNWHVYVTNGTYKIQYKYPDCNFF